MCEETDIDELKTDREEDAPKNEDQQNKGCRMTTDKQRHLVKKDTTHELDDSFQSFIKTILDRFARFVCHW